jgi:sulfur carrier protein
VRVIANGDPVEIAEGSSLKDLYDALGVSAKWVVAELNGEPIERAAVATVGLADGDRVELVRATAGG